jgi:hypothetical protein
VIGYHCSRQPRLFATAIVHKGMHDVFHRKELIQPVNVGTPDARFGQLAMMKTRRKRSIIS